MIEFLIKSTMIWLVWGLAYLILLQYNSNFIGRRLYLYVAIITGLVFPFLYSSMSIITNNQSEILQIITPDIQAEGIKLIDSPVINTQHSFSWIVWTLSICYFLGLLYFMVKTLRSFVFFYKITKHTKPNIANLYYTDSIEQPLSFFGKILFPKTNTFSQDTISMIINHEKAHFTKKHFLDLVFIQVCCIVFWFNPIIWIYKKLFALIHEHEADAIASQNNPYEYAKLLLEAVQKRRPILAHSFFYSPIKNRITMLSKKTQKKQWGLLIALPIMALSTLAMKPNVKNSIMFNLDKSKGITVQDGNKIVWAYIYQTDSIELLDAETNEWRKQVVKRNEEDIAVSLNDVRILNKFDKYQMVDTGRMQADLKQIFKENFKNQPSNMQYFNIVNVVIDKNGAIRSADVHFGTGPHFSIPMKNYREAANDEFKKLMKDFEIKNQDLDKSNKLILTYLNKNYKINVPTEYKNQIVFYKTLCTVTL